MNNYSIKSSVDDITYFGLQRNTKLTTLDVGEDRLVVHVNPDKFHLDIDLPCDVDNSTCGAQFNKSTKVQHGDKAFDII